MKRTYKYYDLVMAAFVTVLLCSNLIGASKIATVAGFTFGAGVFFFPISYIFGDILTEVYGYARARKVVWAGFGAMAFASLMSWVVVGLPPAQGYANQAALEAILGGTPRIANRLLRRVRDFADVDHDGRITKDVAKGALDRLGVDKLGLDEMDKRLLRALVDRGVQLVEVTLHVGAGTFLPVKVEDVTTHRMHAEWGEVTQSAADVINRTRATGGRIIPVGTTALRLIESAADSEGRMRAWQGKTDIFIYPGYTFRVTDALMTNFHLPKSTLLMLVAALMGQDRMRRVYAHAIESGYRFFSYGDASLLIPDRNGA
jgi:hypothetical protein